MNIKITYDWLLDYLDTDATPSEIQQYLSLCGPSVEKVEKKDDKYVFDIEITSNRIDAASVIGIAQECKTILPQFGKKARLTYHPSLKENNNYHLSDKQKEYTLNITNDQKLCSRFTAIVLKNVLINPSPDFIQQRLNVIGIKTINTVVDISNYLMVTHGQPVHIFDYDRIKNHTMIVRESVKGEYITTLDGKTFALEGGDIVIEDGGGRLIDLCGIRGGLNSSIIENTKNIVLFVQIYNKEKIRKTSMHLGQHTIAATYFEKGLDEERVYPTLQYGIELLQKYARAQPASEIYDIYPHPYTPRIIDITPQDIRRSLGIDIEEKKICLILENLGFSLIKKKNKSDAVYSIAIPSYRKNDIIIKEDIIEEIARIYGYFNFPSKVPGTDLTLVDRQMERMIFYENKVKHMLNLWGAHEMYNYSMIAEKQIANLDLDKKKHLKIKNTISSNIEYMRISLVPSLLKNMHDNEAFVSECLFFELAHVYHKKSNALPDEKPMLTIAANTDFFDLKGIVESLFEKLNIHTILFIPQPHIHFLSNTIQASIGDVGWIGKLARSYQMEHEIKKPVYLAELDFEKLISHARLFVSYQPINPYAGIALDLTLPQKRYVYAQPIIESIKKIRSLEKEIHHEIEIIGIYKNKLTLRFHFSSRERNITLEEAKKELANIQKYI